METSTVNPVTGFVPDRGPLAPGAELGGIAPGKIAEDLLGRGLELRDFDNLASVR